MLGIIDIGSNSVRLVIYEKLSANPHILFNEKVFCRLGLSVAKTGRIEGAPCQAALKTFHRFHFILERFNITKPRIVATAAIRQAKNQKEFIKQAKAILKNPIQVLTGKEEAIFSALGVRMGFGAVSGVVADLGGGSLELALLQNGVVLEQASLDMGVLVLQAQHQNNPRLMAKSCKKTLANINFLKKATKKNFYLVGGTWRALAMAHIAQYQYRPALVDHYTTRPTPLKSFCSLIANLSSVSLEQMKQVPSLRRAQLPASAIILKELIKHIAPKRIMFSVSGLREGILYKKLSTREKNSDPLLTACQEYALRSGFDRKAILAYVKELQVWTSDIWKGQTIPKDQKKDWARYRLAACFLANRVWEEHVNHRRFFAAHFLLYGSFMQLNHQGRCFLANVLFHRHKAMGGKRKPKELSGLPEQTKSLSAALGLSFRLAHALSGSQRGILKQTTLRLDKKNITLILPKKLSVLQGKTIERRLSSIAKKLDKSGKIIVK